MNADAPPTIDLTKPRPAPERTSPSWVDDARAWVAESREAGRRRRRRARPVQLTTVLTLAATLTVLGIADSVTGIDLQWYFWASLAIVGLGLVVGAIARRFPVAVTWLIVPSVVGAIAFAGSHASLHDGTGQRDWTPTTTPNSQYRLAFGQGVLDLRSLPAASTPRTIRVTMGAGQVKVLTAPDANVRVVANAHIGQINLDDDANRGNGGVGVSRTVEPPAGATGARITVTVHLADGQIRVER